MNKQMPSKKKFQAVEFIPHSSDKIDHDLTSFAQVFYYKNFRHSRVPFHNRVVKYFHIHPFFLFQCIFGFCSFCSFPRVDYITKWNYNKKYQQMNKLTKKMTFYFMVYVFLWFNKQ